MNDKSTETIFDAVLQLHSAAQRKAYLDLACGDDTDLRRKIEDLLDAHERAEGFYASAGVELNTVESGDSEATLIESPLTEGPGTAIGRYKLLQKIGEGGMGVVYMAEQTEPVTRKVALKIIKLGMDTKQVVARFEAERQALAMMDHPNIAKVLDAGATDTGRPYFVMELVRGVPITEYCDKRKLSTQQRLELFIPVCQAIQHAHQKGVIHRDIKPSNVMVTLHDGNAVPKVIDFGIAKATHQKLTEKTLFTNYAQMIGTPAYMSPEQAEMSGLDVDTRTDVYSLGVLLYELLTGTTPFPARELFSLGYGDMQKIIAEKEPPRPSTRLTEQLVAADISPRQSTAEASGLAIPTEEDVSADSRRRLRLKEQIARVKGDLDWIVMKALEKDRTHRYETVNGLVADIRRHLDNEPVSAAAPTFSYQLHKFARRNRKYARAAAVVAALLVGAVLFSTFQAVRATRASIAATEARNEAQRNAEQARNAQAKETELRQQADTRAKELRESSYFQSVALAYQEMSANRPAHALKLLDDCPEELRGWEWNHVRHWSITGSQPVTHFQEPVYSLAVGPNGRDIALIVGETLWLAELTPGGALQRTKSLATTPRPFSETAPWISFSPDSRLLATAGTGGTVTIWEVATRKPLGSFQGSSNRINVIAFHPSGRQVAVVSSKTVGLTATIDLFETPSGRLIRRIQQGPSVFSVAFSPDGRWLAVGIDYPHHTRVFEVSSGEPAADLFGHLIPVNALAFSPDSRWLASAGDVTVRLWDVSTWKLAKVLAGHTAPISSLAFTRDGPEKTRLVSAGLDREVKVWDPFKPRELLSLRGHTNGISAVVVTSGGRLVSGDLSGDVRVWDTSAPIGHSELLTLTGHTNRVFQVAFHPDDPGRLYSVGEDQGHVWDSFSGRLIDSFPAVWDFTISRDGRHLVHPGTHEMLNTRQSHVDDPGVALEVNDAYAVTNYITSANPGKDMYFCSDISVDGEWLAGGSSDGTLHVWRRETDASRRKLFGHHAYLVRVRFSPDGRHLVSVGEDGEILRWDATRLAEPQQPVRLLSPTAMRETANIGFSPDGQHLATGDGSDGVLVLDVETGKTVLRIPKTHGGIVISARFSPDGRWIASGGADNVVRVWDAATGERKATLIGHTSVVNDAVFSPDGKRLASTGWDQTVKVWALNLD